MIKKVNDIYTLQDGIMVPYTVEMEEEMKHQLKRVGKKFIFTIKNLDPADAGLYSVDVEGVNVFSTDFKSEYKCKSQSK